jgi:asparagine N-glycosylation enzyme membrane subunit Stt3
MSVYSHPYLAAIWLLMLAAECLLLRYTGFRSAFGVLAWLMAFRSAFLLTASFCRSSEAYYYGFWTLQFTMHALAVAVVTKYAFDCLRRRPKLPDSLVMTILLWLSMFVLVVLVLARFKSMPDNSELMAIDQGLLLMLAGIMLAISLCLQHFAFPQWKRDVAWGFTALYTGKLLVASSLIDLPFLRSASWTLGLVVQLSVTLWWLITMRSASRLRA